MKTGDIIALIALVISLLDLILIFVNSKRQNQTANSELETQIRADLNAITSELTDIAAKIETSPQVKAYEKAFEVIEEKYRNAYEDLCQKYLNDKVDKNWVEKMYKEDIKNLVENEEHKEFYATTQSKYVHTKKVYEQWFKQV